MSDTMLIVRHAGSSEALVPRGGGTMARTRYQKGQVYLKGESWIGRWREDEAGEEGGKPIRRHRARVIGRKDEYPTKRLAMRALEARLAPINSPDYRPSRVMTLDRFAEKWMSEHFANRKPSTVAAAQWHLRGHILPQLGGLTLDQIGPERQQSLIAAVAKQCSRKSVMNVLGTLSSMLGTARRWGYICGGVNVRNLSIPSAGVRQSARFFSPEEVRGILERAEQPFQLMFAIAAMAGLRAGELLALKTEDVDLERRLLFVRRSTWRGKIQTTKSERSVAVLPVPEALATRFRAYMTGRPEGFLFLNRHGNLYVVGKVVRKKLWPILDLLGIARCGLHAFRHTHASVLFDEGASPTVAQAQLRHSDPRITLGIYGHMIGDSHRSAVERVARVLDYQRATQARPITYFQ